MKGKGHGAMCRRVEPRRTDDAGTVRMAATSSMDDTPMDRTSARTDCSGSVCDTFLTAISWDHDGVDEARSLTPRTCRP
jgi:hypothetical protein